MGLDAIEITRPIEEIFNIRIEDSELEKISTPGDLIGLVMNKVVHAESSGCLSQQAFDTLRSVLLRQLFLKRRDISPGVRLADLVSSGDRKILLDILAEELGTGPLPDLVRPGWLVNLVIGCSITFAIACTVALRLRMPSVHQGILLLLFFIAGVGVGWAGVTATQGFRNEFPDAIQTVGDLSRWIVAHKSDLPGCTPGKWTREQVAARIRAVVIENLDCAKNYREDASFIKELGMDDG